MENDTIAIRMVRGIEIFMMSLSLVIAGIITFWMMFVIGIFLGIFEAIEYWWCDIMRPLFDWTDNYINSGGSKNE